MYKANTCTTQYVQCIPLTTEPGVEDIATKFEQEYVQCVRNEEECVCSIVATRSSSPPASGKIIKEMPVLVASGTPYIIYIYIYIQGVPGGMCQTLGECSLC